MMVHTELATVTSQNKLISDSGNDADHEDGHAKAGDHGFGTDAAASDLPTSDLDGASKSERHQIPTELGDEIASPKTSSLAKKKVMPAPGKTNGTATPTVKKVLNSGTFGMGSVKPTGAKVPVTATKPSAPALKKSATSPPSAFTKIAPPSPAAPKPAATATRRASVVPAKTTSPALSKQSLSASATTKPSEEDATLRASPTGSIGSARSPAPTPAPTKPRVSVSAEATRKAPLTARPSMATSGKPVGPPKVTTASRSSAALPAKASRPMGSISSVKEGSSKERKDDDKAVNAVKGQLDEANKLLESKTAVVADLEARIVQLEELLLSANADVDAKANSAAELQGAIHSAEATLAETREALNILQEELVGVKSSRESVEKELEAAKSTVSAREEVEQSLHSQILDLQASVATYKEQISELEKNHAAATATIEETAAVERADLHKVRADLKANLEEMEALKVSHAKTVEDLEAQISKLEDKLAAEETSKTQLTTLKAEKEEAAHRISELEVEVLELKEAQDILEDTQNSLQKRVKELDQELADAKAAATLANDNAKMKETEFIEELREMTAKHEKVLEDEAARFTLVTTSLKNLQAEYAEALASHEQAKQELVDQGTKHLADVKDLEKVHADAISSLSSQLEQVSRELNEQEAVYNSKVDEVKAEHTKLLEEAFERAKNEASHAHTQELQALRSDSNQALEQLQELNRVSLEELKATHTSQLESEVNGLNKQITALNTELKATQDDLAKAKASLESTRGEAESLARQRDEARAQAEAAPSINPEQAEEIARLTRELMGTKDDLSVMTDMLALTKSSMAELSDKQANELEAAAERHADEVLQLRAVHGEEVSQLATQTSGLQVRISDLEGELATVKATLAAQEAASPKVNGTGVSHPPSSPGVTKDELQQLHEAHNLKIHDIQAEHDKEIGLVKAELETAFGKIAGLEDDISRKTMEIHYHEQEREEQQEQITRLREDVENLSEKITQQST